jgi:hypothetical protein
VAGVEIGELLPRLAKIADKYTILRSVGIGSEKWEHSGGAYWLTGNPRTRATPKFPMYGSVMAKLGSLANSVGVRLRPSERVNPSKGRPAKLWTFGESEDRSLKGTFGSPAARLEPPRRRR